MDRALAVTITITGDYLVVVAPHSESFTNRASKLHGKWNGHAWIFKAKRLEKVKALCLELFTVVEMEEAPVFEMDDDVTELEGEITNPSIDLKEDETTAITVVTKRGSKPESNPVKPVIRELNSFEDKTAIMAEINRLRNRIRELEKQLKAMS
jgi:hypothetical protein